MSPEHVQTSLQKVKEVITLCKNGRKQQCKTVINVHSVVILFNPSSFSLFCQHKCLILTCWRHSTSAPPLILPPKAGYWRCNSDPPARVCAVETDRRGALEAH